MAAQVDETPMPSTKLLMTNNFRIDLMSSLGDLSAGGQLLPTARDEVTRWAQDPHHLAKGDMGPTHPAVLQGNPTIKSSGTSPKNGHESEFPQSPAPELKSGDVNVTGAVVYQ